MVISILFEKVHFFENINDNSNIWDLLITINCATLVIMDEESVNEGGVKCTLEYFSETNAVNEILDNVVNVYSSEHSSEVAHEKLKRVLNTYIDQPHLLDPYIEQFLNKLIGYVKNPEISLAIKQEVFRYMFLFINVRGYKVIVRLLPHEVSISSELFTLLQNGFRSC